MPSKQGVPAGSRPTTRATKRQEGAVGTVSEDGRAGGSAKHDGAADSTGKSAQGPPSGEKKTDTQHTSRAGAAAAAELPADESVALASEGDAAPGAGSGGEAGHGAGRAALESSGTYSAQGATPSAAPEPELELTVCATAHWHGTFMGTAGRTGSDTFAVGPMPAKRATYGCSIVVRVDGAKAVGASVEMLAAAVGAGDRDDMLVGGVELGPVCGLPNRPDDEKAFDLGTLPAPGVATSLQVPLSGAGHMAALWVRAKNGEVCTPWAALRPVNVYLASPVPRGIGPCVPPAISLLCGPHTDACVGLRRVWLTTWKQQARPMLMMGMALRRGLRPGATGLPHPAVKRLLPKPVEGGAYVETYDATDARPLGAATPSFSADGKAMQRSQVALPRGAPPGPRLVPVMPVVSRFFDTACPGHELVSNPRVRSLLHNVNETMARGRGQGVPLFDNPCAVLGILALPDKELAVLAAALRGDSNPEEAEEDTDMSEYYRRQLLGWCGVPSSLGVDSVKWSIIVTKGAFLRALGLSWVGDRVISESEIKAWAGAPHGIPPPDGWTVCPKGPPNPFAHEELLRALDAYTRSRELLSTLTGDPEGACVHVIKSAWEGFPLVHPASSVLLGSEAWATIHLRLVTLPGLTSQHALSRVIAATACDPRPHSGSDEEGSGNGSDGGKETKVGGKKRRRGSKRRRAAGGKRAARAGSYDTPTPGTVTALDHPYTTPLPVFSPPLNRRVLFHSCPVLPVGAPLADGCGQPLDFQASGATSSRQRTVPLTAPASATGPGITGIAQMVDMSADGKYRWNYQTWSMENMQKVVFEDSDDEC